ncbi:hypothetical protein WQ54_29540 [Bacillus sp. SA1-12]|uniref:hypothetical protein n=1 Tax=Bacillus sp. SA1-12 TaxID=1455638 RepID=UPI000627211B|nr:hypothetical protein [Bacillus sp. SA1-12]KKI88665.1 hypothetical protein WQ54_29540 [Bacillus sp. SA1-12]
MQLTDYIGKSDLEIIHFVFSLIKEIDYKIKNKTFFYKNQVTHYINERVDHFINRLHVRCSLQKIYKAEIHHMITPKLKNIFERHSLLSCV